MEPLSETDYKPDFEIADKYISFSSELLRLSLLAISALGAFIMLSLKNGESHFSLNTTDKYLLFITLIAFALASGAALAHRFWASDSLSYHVAYLRKKTQEEKDGRRLCFKNAARFMILSEYFFGFGIFFFALTIFLLLLIHN